MEKLQEQENFFDKCCHEALNSSGSRDSEPSEKFKRALKIMEEAVNDAYYAGYKQAQSDALALAAGKSKNRKKGQCYVYPKNRHTVH